MTELEETYLEKRTRERKQARGLLDNMKRLGLILELLGPFLGVVTQMDAREKREYIRAYMQGWRKRHPSERYRTPESHREYMRAWYSGNRDKMKNNWHRYYEKLRSDPVRWQAYKNRKKREGRRTASESKGK